MDFANLIKAGCQFESYKFRTVGDISSGSLSHNIRDDIVFFPITFKVTFQAVGTANNRIIEIHFEDNAKNTIFKVGDDTPVTTGNATEYYIYTCGGSHFDITGASTISVLQVSSTPILKDYIFKIDIDNVSSGDLITRASMYGLKFNGDLDKLRKNLRKYR